MPDIPVYGQYPNLPRGRRKLGEAPDNITVQEVAAKFNIKRKNIVSGYIAVGRPPTTPKNYWLIVTLAFGDER